MAKFTNGLLCFPLFCALCASGAFHPFWVTLASLSLRALLLKKLALSLNVIFVLLASFFGGSWLVFLCAFHAF